LPYCLAEQEQEGEEEGGEEEEGVVGGVVELDAVSVSKCELDLIELR